MDYLLVLLLVALVFTTYLHGGHVQKPAHTAEAHVEVVQPLGELQGFSKHQCSRRASTMGNDGTSRKGTVQNYAN